MRILWSEDESLKMQLNKERGYKRGCTQKQKSSANTIAKDFVTGLGDRNWTCDLLNPIQARYQTALHPDGNEAIHIISPLKEKVNKNRCGDYSFSPYFFS